jgi:tetratricopeptide (TPR) repeat protein
MWTGQSSSGLRAAMNWDDARAYCSALTLGSFSMWRLPTLDEMRSEEYLYPVTNTDKDGSSQTVDYLGFKGNVRTAQETRIWTSSMAGSEQYVSVFMGPPDVFGILFKGQLKAALNPDRSEAHERVSKVSDRNAVLCVRAIDADLLQIAHDAQVSHPIPDILTLKASVPLNLARSSFRAGRYQDAIAQSQAALAIKPDFADAFWGIGISNGMLGQWDEAISNFETALKIDKNDGDAKDSLQWAKDSQKAVKQGKIAKAKPPIWK